MFKLKKHQEFLRSRQILTDKFPSVLLFHGTGSGKTCSSLVLIKQNIVKKELKRVYILGDKLIRSQFKKEINEGKCGIGSMHKIDVSFGYRKFFNTYKNSAPGVFDNTMFVIDEVQRIKHPRDNEDTSQIVSFFKNLFLVNKCKLVLLSATPMTDLAEEIKDILAIMYHNNTKKQIESGEYDKSSEQFTRDYIDHVRISYLRFPIGGVDPGYPKTTDQRVRIALSPGQRSAYDALASNVDRERFVNMAKLGKLMANVKKRKRQLQVIYTSIVSKDDASNGLNQVVQAAKKNGFAPYGTDKAKARRAYAVISGETPDPVRESVLGIFRSPENSNGEKIALLIGTRVLAIGVDLKNVRAMHILEPFWNYSVTDQVRGRGIRFGSHNDLPENKQRIHVYTYIVKNSIDTDKVKRSVKKDKKIKKIEYILKNNAFDCKHLEEENALPSRYDHKRECQYRSCDTNCTQGTQGNAVEIREKIFVERRFPEYASALDLFKTTFGKHLVVSRDALFELTGNDESLLTELVHNLKRTIDQHHVMKNIYGQTGYLIELSKAVPVPMYMVHPQSVLPVNVFSSFGIYNQYDSVQAKTASKKEVVQQVPVSGIAPYSDAADVNAYAYGYFVNEKFGIVINPFAFLSKDNLDRRLINRGKMCSSYAVSDLRSLVQKLSSSSNDIPKTRKDLCELLQQKLKEKNWMFNRRHTVNDVQAYWTRHKG